MGERGERVRGVRVRGVRGGLSHPLYQMHQPVHNKLDADGNDDKTHDPGDGVEAAGAENLEQERRRGDRRVKRGGEVPR